MSDAPKNENFSNLMAAHAAITRADTIVRKAAVRGLITAGETAELLLLTRKAGCAVLELHNRIVIGLPAPKVGP